jgi:peptidoglycan/LPS O-acetylase OafA/YrhL
MNRHNNFDALRLLAAAGVMALHFVDLSQEAALAPLTWVDTKMALSVFFVISGYLVFMSWDRAPHWPVYLARRLRRIVPAYAVVVAACAVLGLALSTLSWRDYFGLAWGRYLLANLGFLNFLQPSLPGVFTDNPMPGAPVNGALWTIKVELMFYIVVPAIAALCRRFGHHRVLGVGFALSCLWWGGFVTLAWHTGRGAFFELAKQMPGQLMFFLPGAWCYLERQRLQQLGWRVGAAGLLTLVLAYRFDQTHANLGVFIYPLGLAACVFWAAHILPWLGSVTRHGDLSYGLYIWHFPVIQALVQLGVFKASPWGGVTLTLCLVLLLAWASWRWVESPWLRSAPLAGAR